MLKCPKKTKNLNTKGSEEWTVEIFLLLKFIQFALLVDWLPFYYHLTQQIYLNKFDSKHFVHNDMETEPMNLNFITESWTFSKESDSKTFFLFNLKKSEPPNQNFCPKRLGNLEWKLDICRWSNSPPPFTWNNVLLSTHYLHMWLMSWLSRFVLYTSYTYVNSW